MGNNGNAGLIQEKVFLAIKKAIAIMIVSEPTT